MTTTQELYGMPEDKLNAIIGKEINNTVYRVRINILKNRLKHLVNIDPVHQLIPKVNKAIKHWEELMGDK